MSTANLSDIRNPHKASPSLSDQQTKEFIENLVILVVGIPLEEIPEEKRVDVITEVVDIYLEFINNYVKKIGGRRIALQNQIFQASSDLSLLARFEDLDEHLQTAHNEFINQVTTL